MDELKYHIAGSRTIDDKEIGEYDFYSLTDLCYIDMFSPVRNYLVPHYHTSKVSFTDARKYEAAKQLFPNLVQLDSGLLVNMDQVETIEKTRFGLIAHFRGGLQREIAKNKIHMDIVRDKMR
ncbi:dipeptidyl aminopeptidase [Paenibacillus silvae]|uniref:dipeptidyl aminopeptidase n=1 Tax=Paenibacillus silvae TaxID=1325358 RepID=UPI0025A2962A|nr:dipeptidyl aminopeptidase [Paenibacillus silvae]MDM5278776.1 dipeptidyl aminopeptidase [Paenibacillus silvae]